MWRRRVLVAALLSLFAPPRVVSADEARPPVANIVNGVPTQDFPTVGELVFFDTMGSPLSSCTGTLIGCETVLTAAHCVCNDAADAASCLLTPPGQVLFFLQHAGIFQAQSIAISSE